MLQTLKSFFEKPTDSSGNIEQQLKRAATALLTELVYADHQVDDKELKALHQAVGDALSLPNTEIEEILKLASQAAKEATSLYEFTRLINDHYNSEQKCDLIESMWRIAYADGDLDKYEEHMIRKVAELIYVSHKDFIRLKLAAAC